MENGSSLSSTRRCGRLITKSSKLTATYANKTDQQSGKKKKLEAKPITKSPSMIDENLHGRRL
jgi:hypothetical protein